MFSPDAASLPPSQSRPKRTRTAGPDDSIKLPQAKRQRSALRKDTFEPLTEASLKEVAGKNLNDRSMNGHAKGAPTVTNVLGQGPKQGPKQLTLRGGRKTEKRSDRSAASLILASTEFYSVAQLPCLPEEIRKHPDTSYTSIISPEHGYAVALTHSDALIWSYNSPLSTPAPKDVISSAIPASIQNIGGPLPLAAFTPTANGGEPGLLVVIPKSGSVIYWESISSIPSLVPGQSSSGVQSTIPGMINGETVTRIVNAEPAGFVLIFSHGRVAHLTVRDQMGRPGIEVRFLRKLSSSSAAGLFGSIRNVFGGDRRKGIANIRGARSSKGQRDIVVATEDGIIELWDLNLSTGNNMLREVNVKDEILESLKHHLPDGSQGSVQFKILDFHLDSTPNHTLGLVERGSDQIITIVVLTALSHDGRTSYYLLELAVLKNSSKVNAVHHIKCYTDADNRVASWVAQLCVPAPGRTAFVVLGTAIVVYSLAKMEASPSSQLLMESHALPDPFQDSICFQEDTVYRVLSYAAEDSDGANKHPACVIAVQGFGNVRITATIPERSLDDLDDFTITPRTKLEQAIFFGTIRQNPLDLTGAQRSETSIAEIEDAALQLSDDILSSASKYLPSMSPSVDQQMRLRAKALDDLAIHLQKHHNGLSRSIKWKLLWNAEKLSAAQAMWKVQETIQKRQPKDREHSLMEFALVGIHEAEKTTPQSSKGEKDRVRHWLIHDPGRIEHLMVWLVYTFDVLKEEEIDEPALIADYYREACDLWTAAYTAVLAFREDNAQLYGLGDELLHEGILTTGYAGLPAFWTTSADPLGMVQSLINESCKFLAQWWNVLDSDKGNAPPRKTLEHIASKLPDLIEVVSRLLTEEDLRNKEEAVNAGPQKGVSKKTQHLRLLIMAMAPYGNMRAAIAVAEKLGDTALLVKLNLKFIKMAMEQAPAGLDPDADAQLQQELDFIHDQTETYYTKFGMKWAFSYFQQLVHDGELGTLLIEAQGQDQKQKYLDNYLHSMKKYGKIGWINDIIGRREYSGATKTLVEVAEAQETNLWNKRTELCLAKLADLAAREQGSKMPTAASDENVAKVDAALSLLDIQDRLYAHVTPAIQDTIDDQAAHEAALATFGRKIVRDKPSATRKLLTDALGALIFRRPLTPEQLIDIFTLMDPVEFRSDDILDPGVYGHEFYLALKVVDSMISTVGANEAKKALPRLIWRRAMIRDDWTKLNETASKPDDEVEGDMMRTALFQTLVLCAGDVQTGTAGSIARLWSPTDILDAEVFPDVLQARFKENERQLFRSELEVEQEKLTRFVETARLQAHFEGLVSAARAYVREQADGAGEEVAKVVTAITGIVHGGG